MDRYLVIGNPIKHSRSPFIHTLFARQTSQQINYQAVEVGLDQFESYLHDFFAQGGRGCNVTVPFKERAAAFASQLTERARLAGAVNTLKKLDDGGVLGDNTDGAGLVQDLLNNHITISNANVLLLGAGGAARGVILPLLQHLPASFTLANRTLEKAQHLAELFAPFGQITALSFEQLSQGEHKPFDLIINATSASLNDAHPNISPLVIGAHTIAYDMVYGAGVTSSNQWMLANGAAHAIDGLGMLVGQAAESFAMWRGIKPGTAQVLRELRRNLMN